MTLEELKRANTVVGQIDSLQDKIDLIAGVIAGETNIQIRLEDSTHGMRLVLTDETNKPHLYAFLNAAKADLVASMERLVAEFKAI